MYVRRRRPDNLNEILPDIDKSSLNGSITQSLPNKTVLLWALRCNEKDFSTRETALLLSLLKAIDDIVNKKKV